MDNAKKIKQSLAALGFKVFGGENAPYIWLKAPKNLTSWKFFDKLLKEAHVVVTPGSLFGREGEGYVRLSTFADKRDVKKAMESIKKNFKNMTHSIKVQGHGEDNRTTKVLKFGGTSVADAKNINRVIDIVLANEPNTVVVVSALGGITDELIKLATLASKGDSKYKIIFSSICERHDKVVKELIKPENLEKVLLEINKKYSELGELIKISLQLKNFLSSHLML